MSTTVKAHSYQLSTVRVGTPTDAYDAANKAYVDGNTPVIPPHIQVLQMWDTNTSDLNSGNSMTLPFLVAGNAQSTTNYPDIGALMGSSTIPLRARLYGFLFKAMTRDTAADKGGLTVALQDATSSSSPTNILSVTGDMSDAYRVILPWWYKPPNQNPIDVTGKPLWLKITANTHNMKATWNFTCQLFVDIVADS